MGYGGWGEQPQYFTHSDQKTDIIPTLIPLITAAVEIRKL